MVKAPRYHRSNGMHIRRVTNKQGVAYQCIVKVSGQSQAATFPNKGQAREWGIAKEKEMLDMKYFPEHFHQKYLLRDAIQKYREDVLPMKALKSQKTHRYILGWWEENLGDTHLQNISTDIIDRYRQLLLKKPLTIHTVNTYYDVLKHVFKLANSPRWNMTTHNPFQFLHRWKVKEERCPLLTADQLESLLRACRDDSRSPHMYTFVRLALATGGRLKELLNATWSQINFTTATITFTKTKSRKDRTVPLDNYTLAFLKKKLEEQTGLNDQQYVNFTNRLSYRDAYEFAHRTYIFFNERTGKPLTDIHKSWNTVKRHADVPEDLRCHDLRHLYASHMAQYGGADIGTLAELLGHANIQQTRRYRHLTEKYATGLVQQMADTVFGRV